MISSPDCTDAARSNGIDSPALPLPICLRAVTAIFPASTPSITPANPPSPHVRSAPPPVIGIVGGVGSGKSSVFTGLSGFALKIIDADRIGHQQLLRPPVRAALVTQFGPEILNADGEIHRPSLAALVFGDTPPQQAARETLNQIVRPGIRSEILHQLQNIPSDIDAVILDAALLLESGLAPLCDLLIFIDTPEDLRWQRAARSRGWSLEELRRRELSQWPLDQKRAACSHSIDNSGSLASSTSQLQQILQKVLSTPVSSAPAE